jgi:hypothetical protein
MVALQQTMPSSALARAQKALQIYSFKGGLGPKYAKEARKAVQNPFENAGNPFKFLWGNTSEFDLLNLRDNEGSDYKEDMDLLFAGKYPLNYKVRDGELILGIATGDLRNVFETILSIPEGAKQESGTCLNDI